MKRLIQSAAIAALATMASEANAREIAFYDISYIGDASTAVGGATFNARAEVETYAGGINGVVGLTGFRNGEPITLVDWMEFPEPGQINQPGNDNLLKNTWPFFTPLGISFSAGGLRFKMFYIESGLIMECRGSGPRCTNAIILRDVTVTRVADAVPEPASWAMMIGGIGLIGGTMRRRARVRATATYA